MPEYPNSFSGGGPVRTYGIASFSRGTAVAASGTPNTKGSIVQITASTEFAANWLVVNAQPTGTNTNFLLDILVGGSGSEVVIIPDLMIPNHYNESHNFKFPIFIPAGARISARSQSSAGGSQVNVSIQTISGNALAGGVGPSYVDAYGSTSNSTGTVVDPGGSGGTKGSWVEITSATSRPINWLTGCFHVGDYNLPSAQTLLVDIAIGGSGSETIIIPDIAFGEALFTSSGDIGSREQSWPIFIPQGSRIAARSQISFASSAGDREIYMKLYGC